MPQLHLYVPEKDAAELRARARAARMPLSKFLASLVRREIHKGWPPGFFETYFGGWKGEPLERPPQLESSPRDPL